MTKFLKEHELSNEIINLFKNSKEKDAIYCAVAFWGNGAQELIQSCKASKIKIILNLDSGATNPSVVEELRRNRKVKIKNVGNLHSKVYIRKPLAIVTSANCSSNGLGFQSTAHWIEAGVLLNEQKSFKSIISWFEKLWKIGNNITLEDIEVARRTYNARSRKRSIPKKQDIIKFDITEQLVTLEEKKYTYELNEFIKSQLTIVSKNFFNQNGNTIHYSLIDDVVNAQISLAVQEPAIQIHFYYKINELKKYRRRFYITINNNSIGNYLRASVDVFDPNGKNWPKFEDSKKRKMLSLKCQKYLKEKLYISEITKGGQPNKQDLSLGFKLYKTKQFNGLIEMIRDMCQRLPEEAFRPRWDDPIQRELFIRS